MSVLLVAGCGSQAAPAAPRGRTSTSRAPVRSTPSPTRSTPTPSIPYDEATSGLVGAINSAGEARYSSTFGMVRLNHSQHGTSVEMTDLARGRALVASARAGHPKWAGVPVTLVQVPYSMKRLTTAQDAMPDSAWSRYQLVSVGIETCRYLSVGSSDPRLRNPSSGRPARERLGRTLAALVGIPVVVTWESPAFAG